uniref:Uncharacterized protein n=1 Tax=Siphoviridae sp. ctQtc11 TaxID=2825497 RepID=A0A8S5P4U8_9CAUD|nr:MAG TPA: hypothetical protein [Siphoviridae sp. ctQtc11]
MDAGNIEWFHLHLTQLLYQKTLKISMNFENKLKMFSVSYRPCYRY